jgi:hypothetical protein
MRVLAVQVVMLITRNQSSKKTALGPRGQTETSLKIEDLRSVQ